MNWLEAAKRGAQVQENEPPVEDTKKSERQLFEQRDYEATHPQFLAEFKAFASEKGMRLFRHPENQELYADSGSFIYGFRSWGSLFRDMNFTD